MTTRHLSRLGGAAAMIAALLRAVGSVVPSAPETTTLAGLYLVTDVFILLGLMGWYVAQHERVRLSGLLGFVVSVVGVAVIRSNGGFPGVDTYSIGAPLLVIGLIVLAASAWRAGLMAAWVPGALLVAAVLGRSRLPGARGEFAVRRLRSCVQRRFRGCWRIPLASRRWAIVRPVWRASSRRWWLPTVSILKQRRQSPRVRSWVTAQRNNATTQFHYRIVRRGKHRHSYRAVRSATVGAARAFRGVDTRGCPGA